MNGHCCASRLALLKWPALLALALMFSHAIEQPLLASALATDDTLPPTVQSGPVQLSVSIDRDQLRVADPFQLTLRARAPQGVRVQFPDMTGRLGDFVVTRSNDSFDVPDGAFRTWTRVLRLESQASGSRELPPITLAWTDTRAEATDDTSGTLATPGVAIAIVSEVEANADPTRFRDIKGTVELAEPAGAGPAWRVWAAAGLSVLALAGLGLLVARRRSLTARQWALRELERLEQSGLLEAGEFDGVLCRVTDILRLYIERTFAIHAPQLSTPEFLALAESSSHFDSGQRRLLQAILELSDYVKFARYGVTAIDAERAITQGRWFIEQTSPPAADVPPQPTTEHQPRFLPTSA